MEQVAATKTGNDRIALWWLGHSGYLLRWHDVVVMIDPYLSNSLAEHTGGRDLRAERRLAPPLDPASVTCGDLLLITHDHVSHCDPETVPALLAASPQMLMVVPAPLADFVADEIGVPDERLVPIRAGEVFEHRGVVCHAIPAAHDQVERVEDEAYRCLGYVVQCDGVTLYHSGDTVPYRGQEERLRPYRAQLALLPISGRDTQRQAAGVSGNLTIAEAARLAHAIGAQTVVPCHYDMFEFSSADVQAFEQHVGELYPDLRAVVLEPGSRWLYPGDST